MSPLSNDPTQTESAGHNRNYYDELVKTYGREEIIKKQPSLLHEECPSSEILYYLLPNLVPNTPY